MLVIYFKIYFYVRADVFLEDKCGADEYGCRDQTETHPNNLKNVVVVDFGDHLASIQHCYFFHVHFILYY